MRMSCRLAVLSLSLVLSGGRAVAGDANSRNVFEGDHLTVGAGAIYEPSYDGSDDYVVSPIPIARGRIRGIEISPRQGGVALDLVPDAKDARIALVVLADRAENGRGREVVVWPRRTRSDLGDVPATRARAELVMERGAENFTLADACRVAGVTTAAPYRHFRSKQEIL